MGEERIRPEGSFRCELLRLGRELLERLPAEAVGARLRDALRDAACRRGPRKRLVVRGERGAAVLALLLAAEERVRYITEQCGAHAGEEEAFHGLPGCRGQLMRGCSDDLRGAGLLQGWAGDRFKGLPRAAFSSRQWQQQLNNAIVVRAKKKLVQGSAAPRSKLSRSELS